jgi:hypothetical protein
MVAASLTALRVTSKEHRSVTAYGQGDGSYTEREGHTGESKWQKYTKVAVSVEPFDIGSQGIQIWLGFAIVLIVSDIRGARLG